jgi:hypothetical protein
MRTMRGFLTVAGVAIIGSCLFGGTVAQAAPVTFQFTLTVDQVDDSGGLLFGEPLQTGDALKGYVTYDTAAADTEPVDPNTGYYEMLGPVSAFGLLTPRTLVTDDFFVTVANNVLGQDALTMEGWTPINADSFDYGFMSLNVVDKSGTWLSSDLPPANLSLAQLATFETLFRFQAWRNDMRYHLEGHLTFDGPGSEDPPPAVPEPASLMLLGTGLLGLLKVRRDR